MNDFNTDFFTNIFINKIHFRKVNFNYICYITFLAYKD